MLRAKGRVIEGHRIASGTSLIDRRFPSGSIQMQMPFFKEQGLDLDAYFEGHFVTGTLNVSFAPRVIEILKPEYFMREISWADIFPPENFYLSPSAVTYGGITYRGLLYIPDPATKPDHFNPPTAIDVLAEPIPDIGYGSVVELHYNPVAISLAGTGLQDEEGIHRDIV